MVSVYPGSIVKYAVYISVSFPLCHLYRDTCVHWFVCIFSELEAYGSLVSALRAQGELSKEKRKLLQDLASTLNISMERHRAEVRRAVNDEKLATIAEQ